MKKKKSTFLIIIINQCFAIYYCLQILFIIFIIETTSFHLQTNRIVFSVRLVILKLKRPKSISRAYYIQYFHTQYTNNVGMHGS